MTRIQRCRENEHLLGRSGDETCIDDLLKSLPFILPAQEIDKLYGMVSQHMVHWEPEKKRAGEDTGPELKAEFNTLMKKIYEERV